MMNKTAFSFFLKSALLLSIVGIFFFSAEAAAANSAFTQAYDALYGTFVNARSIVYVISGFGLIGFAMAAIMGKFDWMWLGMIAVALFTLAAAEFIVKTAVEYGGGTSVLPQGQTMESQLDNAAFEQLGYDGALAEQAIDNLRDRSF